MPSNTVSIMRLAIMTTPMVTIGTSLLYSMKDSDFATEVREAFEKAVESGKYTVGPAMDGAETADAEAEADAGSLVIDALIAA